MNARLQPQSVLNTQPVPPILPESGESWRETVMTRLKAAAEDGDELAFISAYQLLDEEELSAEDFVLLIRLSLEAGAHGKARKITFRGAELHPSDAELQKYAYVFAPPKDIRSTPAHPHAKANNQWMREHARKHRGQWVALRNGQLLGASASRDELIAMLDDRTDVMLAWAY